MTFLQPFILWGLPLVLLPVIIHLINRMRHRPQPWAAMRFLLSASRASVSHAKLRQLLILLFRMLAVLALVLFLSRPLAGGWLGWVFSPAPDVIVILLDRSASMETVLAGTTTTAREQALKLLAQAAGEFEETSHLVLIENALRTPQEIARAATLTQFAFTTPTDTAADIPALFQSALSWLIENRAGTAEIWVASDLQRSNWQPEDTRWKSLLAQLSALPQKVRVRLLASSAEQDANTSISIKQVTRRQRSNQAELNLAADLQRNAGAPGPLPVEISLDGVKSQVEVKLDGQVLRWRHKTDLGAKTAGGWGSFEIPADANRRDNATYFVYGPEAVLRAAVVTSDAASGRAFRFAASSLTAQSREPADVASPADVPKANWNDKTLLVWADELPGGAVADRLRTFVEEGGMAVFFPPGRIGAQRFMGVGWGEPETAAAGRTYRIIRWEQDEGPLAKTDEGLSLPLPQITFPRRQGIVGAKNVLAAFDDGSPFLTRQTLGRGEFFFCASLPAKEWSSLADGPVLVPMLQRLMLAGSRRLQPNTELACGELSVGDQAARWTAVDSTAPKDIRVQAGVYRSGDRLVAVNRPVGEDEPEKLEVGDARGLFGELAFQLFQENRSQTDQLQSEFWRIILFGMLAFLLAESILVLPSRSAAGRNLGPMPGSGGFAPTDVQPAASMK